MQGGLGYGRASSLNPGIEVGIVSNSSRVPIKFLWNYTFVYPETLFNFTYWHVSQNPILVIEALEPEILS